MWAQSNQLHGRTLSAAPGSFVVVHAFSCFSSGVILIVFTR